MFKKIFYKNKILFKLLKIYWTINYLTKIFINKKNFYILTKSQHNDEEGEFLESLIPYVTNKNFVEIGFHFRQFNSVKLINNGLTGKLVDTSKYDYMNLIISKLIMKLIHKKIEIIDLFVSPKNINKIFDNNALGFLSLDIDGNDYWVLSEIINNKIFPEVMIIEYNASLLKNSLSIPYIENFNLYTHHYSHCYHGASLTAFNKLLSKNKYHLIKCIAGVNAIFVNDRIFRKYKLIELDPMNIDQECLSRNRKLKNTSKDQFEMIKNLPFVEIK